MGPEGGFSVATVGQNRAMSWLDKLFRREGHRANKQQADPDALYVERDPRGGLRDERREDQRA